MEMPVLQQATALIQKANNILLLTHKKIDGDGVSSVIALTLVLQKLRKNVTAVCADTVPDVFTFLPSTHLLRQHLSSTKEIAISVRTKDLGVEKVRYTIEADHVNFFLTSQKDTLNAKDITVMKGMHRYDLIIVLDTPDLESLGELYSQNVELFYRLPVINLDHHVNNTYFGKVNMVDITAASTTEMLMSLIPQLSEQPLINEDLATLLLTGIITDTGSFQNPNTTPSAFAAASRLVEYGARQQEIIKNIYKTKKLSTLRLWGQVLSNVKTDPVYRIVWSLLSQKELSQLNPTEDDMLSIIDTLLSNAPGAEIILLLVETSAGKTEGYVKTIAPSIDAGKMVQHFKGRGSYSEARLELPTGLYQAETTVLDHISHLQGKRLGIQNDLSPRPSPSPLPSEQQQSASTTVPLISSRELEQTIGSSLTAQLQHKKQPHKR